MSCNDFFKPFMDFKESHIIDVSRKVDFTYGDFEETVNKISQELLLTKITAKSIVVIYKKFSLS